MTSRSTSQSICRASRARRRLARGQASVEVALVLPLVVVLLALVVQGVIVARDQLRVTHAARVAARAAAVDPSASAARAALRDSGVGLDGLTVRVDGSTTTGSLLTVTVSARPSRVAVVGAVVSGVRLSERLVVRVE